MEKDKGKEKSKVIETLKNGYKNVESLYENMNPNSDPKVKRFYTVMGAMLGMGIFYNYFYENEITYEEFIDDLNNERLHKIKILKNRWYGN